MSTSLLTLHKKSISQFSEKNYAESRNKTLFHRATTPRSTEPRNPVPLSHLPGHFCFVLISNSPAVLRNCTQTTRASGENGSDDYISLHSDWNVRRTGGGVGGGWVCYKLVLAVSWFQEAYTPVRFVVLLDRHSRSSYAVHNLTSLVHSTHSALSRKFSVSGEIIGKWQFPIRDCSALGKRESLTSLWVGSDDMRRVDALIDSSFEAN